MGARNNKFNIKYITRSQRWYRYYTTALGSFLVAFSAACTFAPVHNSGAQEVNMEVSEETGWYVKVSNAETVSLGEVRTTSVGQLASAKDTINVETNSPFGYKLLFSASSANLVNEGNSSSYLRPATGTLDTPQALAKDSWGFSLSAQDTPVPSTSSAWSAVPTTPTQIAALDTSNLPSGTDTDIYYGVNASTALASGTYSNTITYTAFSEGVNEQLPTMQDFTQAKCDALTTDVATRLVDTRDLKVYNVTKLKDGNCWMTSNLALDGGRTLTPADSDVVTNHVLPANISDGEASVNAVSQIYSGVSDQATTECNSSYQYCVENDTKYGNLYNWMAATAGTGTASSATTVYESVCPRGWRLPDNGGNGVDKSFGNLLSQYGAGNGENTGANETSGGYTRIIQQAPLYFALAGNYTADGHYNQGRNASYWSRTPISSTPDRAYDLYLWSENGGLAPQNPYSLKAYGASVRCVLGENAENTMQNFTVAMCNALSVSTSSADNRKVLQDTRDGKLYNISRLADNPTGTNNGICWMVSNLAMDGADDEGNVRVLTSSDSQVSGNVTLAANNDESFMSVWDEIKISSNGATTTDAYGSPYGNLYNWHTATAKSGVRTTSGTATYSICPKGWRLPDGAATGNYSYANLMGKSGLPSTNGTSATAVAKVQQQPLFFPMADLFRGTPRSGVGTNTQSGAYHSRTVHSNTDLIIQFGFGGSNGYFNPQNSAYKYSGLSVRCVLGS